MTSPLRVLFVEDREDDAELTLLELTRAGYAPISERVETSSEMRRALMGTSWDIIISDWAMPQFSGLAALAVLKECKLDVPFIIVSGTIGEETAIAALHAGACDFVLKGRLARLVPAVQRELREAKLRHEGRRAEEELRLSEDRYRELFEGCPLPMWVFDVETLGFLAVNEEAVRHYGYSRDEFAKMVVADISEGEGVPVVDHIASGLAAALPWRHRKKDGTVISVELKAHDLTFAKRSARLVLANDVTDRLRAEESLRKTEEQLRQVQKLEAVGRLAGGVAHDFNNLLSVILTYAELLQENFKVGDTEREDLEEIRKAARRATDLTRQLLMFSRQQVMEARVLDLNEVIANVDKMLRRTLGEDIELTSLAASDLGRVRADRGHVEQVVMNLVVNARDAMPTGGKLTIETANVVLDAEYAREHVGVRPGRHVMLAVSDTGCGMDKATQARIFEPFFTTKEVGKGTGLGLSTVLGIVAQSGGSVWVYSEPSKGTTFKVYLPRVDGEVDIERATMAPATLRGAETVLLVEDDDQVRTVVRGILQRSGYTVLEARGPNEAIDICDTHSGTIHILLSDVVMPQMSGPVLAKTLAAGRHGMRTLFMSGYTDDAVIRHGVLGAEVAFLQKPITPEMLTRKVREVLDAEATPNPPVTPGARPAQPRARGMRRGPKRRR